MFNEEEFKEYSLKERFSKLDNKRDAPLSRFRECAKLTLPYILPEDDKTEDDEVSTPYQNEGAKLVTSLASSLLLTTLPPNISFIRFSLDSSQKQLLFKGLGEEARNKLETLIDKFTVAIEDEALSIIEQHALRVPAFDALLSLIITGNVVFHKTDKGGRTHRVDNYCVVRDNSGNLLEVIIREGTLFSALEESDKELLRKETGKDEFTDEDTLMLYTRCVLDGDTWYTIQAIDDAILKDTYKTYTLESFPYMVLRWKPQYGYNYGIGLVQQYIGDFRTLERTSQLLLDISAVAGKVVFGLRYGASVDVDALNSAENGEVIQADFDSDLTMMKVEKGNDFSVLQTVYEQTKRRLEEVFLVASAVTRQAERVTAVEIQYLISEQEKTLGGFYSILSQEFQLPLAKMLQTQLKTAEEYFLSELDGLQLGNIKKLNIVPLTGIEALGRNSKLSKITSLLGVMNNSGLMSVAGNQLNISNIINDITTSLALPLGRYTLSEEAQQQQAMAQAMTEQIQ